jgi:hypothetical protein
VRDHIVNEGETLVTIAERYGFYWETLWNHPENEELKKKRSEAHYVIVGDVVRIPEIREKSESCVTSRLHVFRKRAGILPSLPERTWMEIQLWDHMTHRPVPGAAYKLSLGDGSVRYGRLDDSGLARYDGIDAREARVEFPEWDAADWEPGLPTDTELEQVWIEIALQDENGNPVPDEPYQLIISDGSIRHGWTNADGVARRKDVVKGECKVSFPRLDAKDWDVV